VVYYSTKALQFDGKKPLADATRALLRPAVGTGYPFGSGPGVYAFEDVITGLEANTDYHFCIRAVDSLGNEDQNRVVLSVRTLSADLAMTIDGSFGDWKDLPVLYKDRNDVKHGPGPNWRDLKVINDANNLYLYFDSQHAIDVGNGTLRI
jgi:hypothetical protein